MDNSISFMVKFLSLVHGLRLVSTMDSNSPCRSGLSFPQNVP